ncbi:hypothetical protein EDB89DRAFT_1982083 [Lactarius sanguifluus]|nr:hypothetical protein EDB89DRAFT_1982083 [Lactarius sanguifluus]
MDTRMCFTNFVTTGRVWARTGRIELTNAVGEFTQTVGDLATSVPGKSLLYLLDVLPEPERKDRVAESVQACADQASLLSTADEYARLVNSVRKLLTDDVFARASILYHAWQREMRRCGALNKCTNGTVLKARSRLTASDIHIYSYSQIGNCVRYRKTHCNNVCGTTGTDAKQEYEHTSRLVKPVKTELERFKQERIVDFKKNLEQLLDGVMTRQKVSIQAREALQ